MKQGLQIRVCPTEKRAEALRVLHAGQLADQQTALVHALDGLRRHEESIFDGLLIAEESDVVIGAAWVQVCSGHTAVLWPPDTHGPAAAELMQAVACFLNEHRIGLAQFLVTDDGSLDVAILAAAGFARLVQLAYLTVDLDIVPELKPSNLLSFVPDASDEPERLGELLLSTYEESLDCPELNGVRTADDVLAGYREQGTFVAERWFFVQQAGEDVGALILTEHPDSGNWELVYMGLVPQARGSCWGQEIVQFAMHEAKRGGAPRLVLAVDQANEHALATYQEAGFVAWDHRIVYARLRSDF